MEFSAKELAVVLKGTVDGDETAKAKRFAKIENGKPGDLCFYANPKYENYVYTTTASLLLVNKDFQPKDKVTPTMIRVENAYAALAELLKYVSTHRNKGKIRRFRAWTATYSLTTKFGKKVYVGQHTHVGAHTVVGDCTRIMENVTIGDHCKIGKNCILYPGVRIYPGMVIGDNVIIHSNAVIGADGFGNVPQPDGSWVKIEHLGNVVIGNDVEIGPGTTIGRSEMESTIIGNGVKIDSLCDYRVCRFRKTELFVHPCYSFFHFFADMFEFAVPSIGVESAHSHARPLSPDCVAVFHGEWVLIIGSAYFS